MGKIVGIVFPSQKGAAKAPSAPEAEAETTEATAPETKKKGRPTKADLLAECEELGIDADPGMTNPELKKLVDEAKASKE